MSLIESGTCGALIGAILVLGSSTAFADVVYMKNGDRLTGDVEKIWNEEIFIEPEYGDTYAIELEYVSHVQTDEEFEVELREGRLISVIGRLGLDDKGRPAVIVDDGQTTYPLSKIDNMEKIEEFFDWGVRSDIAVNVASGNSNTKSGRFYAMGRIKLGEHRHLLELTSDGQRAEGVLTKDQKDVYYEDLWTFHDDWFVRGSLSWTRDPIRDLESRSQFYIGPGFHFWDDSDRTLNFSAGPNVLVENIGGEKRKSVAFQTIFRYEQRFLNDDLVLFHQFDAQRVIKGRANKILRSSTGLRWDLPRELYLNMQVNLALESNPAEGQANGDITYLIGVGLELD
jgi:putative salt-induced outer membrane protein YdiY